MNFFDKIINFLRKILPSPFSIAIILTFVTVVFALIFTKPINTNQTHIIQILTFWEKGFWELLAFAMQMMLMLVLGHVLALTSIINSIIRNITKYCTNTPKAAFIVAFFTIIVSLFNWGLGLIFGAVLVRKVGEYASESNIKINYPLIGAAGYTGLMVWHGGLSGSAPLKVAENNHFLVNKIGVIPVAETLFSSMNIGIAAALLLIIPLVFYLIGRKSGVLNVSLSNLSRFTTDDKSTLTGAEKLDANTWFIKLFALFVIGTGIIKAIYTKNGSLLNLNYINFILFGLGLFFHQNLIQYKKAIQEAIVGASGIMIQFPLYAGIMGIMKYSGLTGVFTGFFVGISNSTTFPIFTFISAGMVNMFVPSGGGQWAVQGPVLVDAANQLGVSIPKTIMALAYGDQITNMMQPFWALPLLGITGLKAKQIFPYTFMIMLVASIIFVAGLLL
ncbi:MAG: short-chain fatty acid transporter [Chlorobi bacterium]|nr:short-chain fatty acid transporter [Chlorobiota bacterium]